MDDSNLPWMEKYRPQTMSELCVSPAIQSLLNSVDKGACLPHLHFHGPSGTGKTSTANVIARNFFENNPALYSSRICSLNASDDRGIECVRGLIKSFASSTNLFEQLISPQLAKHPKSKFRLIILDECDALTHDAQAMLRRVMEDYSATCRFILLCNQTSKMIPPILSRCRVIAFGAMDDEQLCKCLVRIVEAENLVVSDDAFIALVETSNGDARRAINNLSNLISSGFVVEQQVDKVYQLVQRLSPSTLETHLNIILSKTIPFSTKIALCNEWIKHGVDISILIHDIVASLLQLLTVSEICRIVPMLSQLEPLLMLGASPKITCVRIIICLDKAARNNLVKM